MPNNPYADILSAASGKRKSSGLDPQFESQVNEVIAAVGKRGLKARLAEGYRSPERQNEYYAQGRTRPGPIITYAQGTQGQHTRGRAADIDLIDEQGRPLASNDPAWRVLGEEAQGRGLRWGGTFSKLKDLRHVELGDYQSSNPYGDIMKAAKGGSPSTPAPAPQPARSGYWKRLRSRMEASKPVGGVGELRRLDDQQVQAQRQREAQTRAEVEKEYKGRRGAYGAPTPTGALHLLANPVSSFTGLFRSDEENINRETQERLRQQQVAAEPEVESIRKEYGQMSAPVRSVAAPVIGRGGGGLLKTAGGIASAFGIAPNRLSEWANRRGEIIETASSLPPLAEDSKEIERGVPEKLATGVADLGVGLGQIILLKKATKLRFNQLLALEAAARNSEKPVDEQLSRAAEAYALGTALDRHMSRPVSAAIAGIPTAAQTGSDVAQGRMSPLDAAIQTGIQTASGAILTSPKPKESRPAMPTTFTEQRQARIEAVEREGAMQRYADIRRRATSETYPNQPQIHPEPSAGTRSTDIEFFKNSKAVDEFGEPLTVYHGTTKDFTGFDPKTVGANFGDEAGFSFADSPIRAAYYAKLRGEPGSQRIVSAQLSLRNPLVVTDRFVNRAEAIAQARIEGRDGIVVKNSDPDGAGNVYIVFDPAQIRIIGQRRLNEGLPDESQIQTKPPVEAQRTEVEPVRRSYQDVQDAIDEREDLLEKQGVNIVKLYDPANTAFDSLPADWKPMPEDLARLYRERDAIGAGELQQNVAELSGRLRATGLSDTETETVLNEFSLGRGTDATSQYMASEYTQRIAAKSPRELTEKIYMALAEKRGIDTRAMDSVEDIGRYGETKTLEDAAKAVRAIQTYFRAEPLPEQFRLAATNEEAGGANRGSTQGAPRRRDTSREADARLLVAPQKETITNTAAQRFFHRDFGEVSIAPSQRKAGKGRIRVVDEQGREHYVKRSDLAGRGNQRMVPLRTESELAPPSERQGVSDPANPSITDLQQPTVTPPVELTSRPPATESQQLQVKGELTTTGGERAAPPSTRGLQRNFRAGANEGTVAFTSETQRDLYDAGARIRRVMSDKGGRGVSFDRTKDPQLQSLAERLGITVDEATNRALDTHSDVRAQMKGVKDGEIREVKDNVSAAPASLVAGTVGAAPPPTVPERPETISAQLQVLTDGRRSAVLIPPGTPEPARPRKMARLETPVGVFLYDPRQVSRSQLERRAKDGTYGELLGHVAPKPELGEPTAVVTAREGDTEVQSSAVAPERAPEQVRATRQQNPDAEIEVGGPELAQQVINERLTGQRERGFARSTENAGLPVGESRYYDPVTHKQSLLNAEQRIRDLGVEGAFRDLTRKQDIDADDVATGIRLMQKLNSSGETQRSAEVADYLQKQLTKSGQTSSAASIISRLSPEGVLMVTQKNLPKGEKLTREQSASLVAMAQRVQQAEARVADLQERVTQLEQTPRSQTRPRMAEKISTVEARLREMETAARARLDARKQQATTLGPQSGASTIPLDIADYAIIGASKIAQKGMSSARWTAEMVSEFGEEIRPHLRSIYKESYKLYDEQRQDLSRQREERSAVKAAGGPVGGDELNRLIAQRAQARSDARKARAEMGRLYQRLTQTRGEKIKAEVVDVIGLPRSIKSSMDLSAPRQGAMWMLSHPVQGTRLFFGKQLQAMKETNYDRFVDQLESDPDFPLMIKSRLALTTPETQAHNLSAREEAFASRLAGHIPGVKHSERAYTTFLDTARASWFKQLKGLAEQKAQAEKRTLEQSDYDAIADFVNISTGRGNLGQGKLNNISPVLNALFFAPRFALSKVQVFDPRVYARLPAGARKQALREAATYYGGMASVALLLKFGLGLSVGLDPEDSEFMKFKVGNTRYDLSNGTGQYIRLAAQLLRNAENKRTGKKDAFGHSFMENMDRFLRYKYSPPAGFVRNVWEGKNPIGEETSAGKEAVELVTPLFLNEMYEAFQKEGLSGAAKTTPGFVGVGVQTYGRRSKSKLKGGFK